MKELSGITSNLATNYENKTYTPCAEIALILTEPEHECIDGRIVRRRTAQTVRFFATVETLNILQEHLSKSMEDINIMSEQLDNNINKKVME